LDHGTSWNSTATHLKELGHHCIALDHRGHGRSGHIAPYDDYHFVDYISDLQACIQQLGLTQFHLVGHSMGGTIASLYAAFSTPSPMSLILVDGLGPKHEEPWEARHRLALHLKQRRQIPKQRPMTFETAVKKYARAHPYLDAASLHLEVSEITTPDPQNSDSLIWSWDARHRNKSAIGFDLRRFRCFVNQIHAPTFSILGETSWYQDLPDIPERLKSYPNLRQQITVPSGHSPHLECPEILAHAIHQCISNIGEDNASTP
jgi:pimeloyl-ACP methyl ester carboxylesterase